ncbi:MAG: RagB/SusD family nutrient uptake outer membrane protein [Rikenellaceae bacterium]|nr:RagB/SusD family nutrient uptake outer membrane protein [Rikenellaceae bacterium]
MKNFRNIINKFALLAAGSAMLVSCNDFLDEMPDNRTTIDTPEKVKMMLVSAYSEVLPIVVLEQMSDNTDDRGKKFNVSNDLWEDAYLFQNISSTSFDSPEEIWNANYRAIASANHALEGVEEMIATGKATPEEIAPQKGEALLCRAYAHFTLCNTFCQAYNPETSATDAGIPYVTKPEKTVFVDYERGTVADVYAMIAADLEAGIPLIDDTKYDKPKYHFTTKAANAFAAKFYLYYGKYEQAVACATAAIGEDPTPNFRNWEAFNEAGSTPAEYTNAYNTTDEAANLFVQGVSSLSGRLFSGRYVTTRNKINETAQSGGPWGSQLPFFGDFPIFQNQNTSMFVPKQYEYFMYTDIVQGIGQPYVITVPFTVEKTIVDRAEAYAMAGDFENAVRDLNYFYKQAGYTRELSVDQIVEYYAAGESVNSLTFASRFPIAEGTQNGLVQACLHARRTLTIHEGDRALDLKRYGVAFTHIVDAAENVTIEPYDKRLAVQLPSAVISAGIPANPR